MHLTRTSLCPVGFPNGFNWYRRRQSSNSRPYPEWVDAVPTLHSEVNSERSGPTVGDDDGAPEYDDLTPVNHRENNLGNCEPEANRVNGEVNRNRESSTNWYSLRKRIKKPQWFCT